MKKKKNFKWVLILIIVVLCIIAFFVLNKQQTNQISDSKKIVQDSNIITVKLIDETVTAKDGIVFEDYDAFSSIFESSKIKEKDFEKNNYVLFSVNRNTCGEKNVTPTKYTIKDEKIKVNISYEADCGVCASEWLYYVIKVDKSVTHASIDLKYKAVNDVNCDPQIEKKPMIYLYPEEEEMVTIKLGHPELLLTSYPKYEASWQAEAHPDGTLIDENGREYYGLFWEGKNHTNYVHDEGFVVERDEIITFLEEKLAILGLNEKEANEFIIYWLPILEENEYNYIYFEKEEEIDNYMPLSIDPKPDTIIRIYMDYKGLSKKINIKEQKLTPKKREGFTVIEWGGSLIS